MSATFKQPEISVRESINSLPQYENLTPEEMGTGTDIGGGETLWGDGSITGSNSNGTYTKWPNGVLDMFVNRTEVFDITSAAGTLYSAWFGLHPFPYLPFDADELSFSAIIDSSAGANGNPFMGRVYTTSTEFQFRVFNVVSATLTLPIHVGFKGRWKA